MNISFPIHTLTKQNNQVITLLKAFFASVVIALCASIAIPLPFSPVPLIIQNTLVLMMAHRFGSRFTLTALAFWVMQGMLGAPVFAMGKSGLAHLLGPSGGYIIGYFVAATIVGINRNRSPFYALCLGNLVIYACGWAVLATYVGMMPAFIVGVMPFIAIDGAKNMIASSLLYEQQL